MNRSDLTQIPASRRSAACPKKKPAPVALLAAIDILLIAAALSVFAFFYMVLPQAYTVVKPETITPASQSLSSVSAGVAAVSEGTGMGVAVSESVSPAIPASFTGAVATQVPVGEEEPVSAAGNEGAATSEAPAAVQGTAIPTALAPGLGGAAFSGKFTTGEVVSTTNSYRSENVNVTLTKMQRNGVTYYVQDIYIRSIQNLRTAFAQNTYGKSITDSVLKMAQENDAIAAINGDHYGVGSIGVVIRNGTLYNARTDGDVLILFYDGTMKTYAAAEFDAQKVMAAGAYQAWSFGPSLMSADGKALSNFTGVISRDNPRTAIGYYEPGHYVFVVVDGRQAGYSDGMSLAELSSLFQELGCKVAYNLDGGKTSAMAFEGSLTNQPTEGGRTTTDIIYIGE